MWVKDSSTFDSQSFELNPEVSIQSLCHIFHPTPQTFENAALFPRLGLSSTSIRHENGALRKHSSIRRDFKKPALIFNVDEKKFSKRSFKSCDFAARIWFNDSSLLRYNIPSEYVWTENIENIYRVKAPFAIFLQGSVNGALKSILVLVHCPTWFSVGLLNCTE